MDGIGSDGRIDIWKLLRRNTSLVPKEIAVPEDQGYRFQIFEILITLLISHQHQDFNWKVTRVQGDKGIDFIGKRPILQLQGYGELVPDFAIIGQCKVRDHGGFGKSGKHANAFDQLYKDLRSYDASVKDVRIMPKIFLGCLVDVIGSEQRIQDEKSLSRLINASVTILDFTEISSLISDNLDILTKVLNLGMYAPDEHNAVIQYFKCYRKKKEVNLLKWDTKISSENIQTGEVLRIDIVLESRYLLNKNTTVRHVLKKGSQFETVLKRNSGEYILIRDTINHRKAKGVIYLRSFAIGNQTLGRLELLEDGNITSTHEIGDIDLEYSFKHRFFVWPSLTSSSDEFIKELLNKTGESPCSIFGVIGPGGIGKSRYIEELKFRPEFTGWGFTKIQHGKQIDRPLGLITDLVSFATIGDGFFTEKNKESIENKLKEIPSNYTSKAHSSFLSLTDSKKENYDPNALAIIVAAWLRIRAGEQHLVIHFADMHQAPKEVVDFIIQVHEIISNDESNFGNSLVFILEGRGISEHSMANPEFQYQLQDIATRVIEISPMELTDSKNFIKTIFETSQNPNHRIDTKDIAAYDALENKIVSSCGGNPMFLIETLRLLIDDGYIRADHKTGWLYLTKKQTDQLKLPSSVENCLQNRLSILQRQDNHLANTLLGCAILDDSIDEELFDSICNYYSTHDRMRKLFSMGALKKITDRSGLGIVTFSHEFYFQVMHLQLSKLPTEEPIIELYLAFTKKQNETSQTIFDEARLLKIKGQSYINESKNLLRKAWTRAATNQLGLLEFRIACYLINMWKESNEVHEQAIYDLKTSLRYGELVLRYGDQKEAIMWLEKISSDLNSLNDNKLSVIANHQNMDHKFLKAKTLVSLGNSLLNQFSTHKSIHYISNAIAIIDDYLLNTDQIEDVDDKTRETWIKLKINATDRLSCAYRIDGNIKSATDAAEMALNASEVIQEGLEKFHAIFGLGRLISLSNPQKAAEYYTDAKDFLSYISHDTKRHGFMISVSETSNQIRMTESNNNWDKLVKDAKQLYNDIRFTKYGLEVGAILLNLGVLYSRVDLSTSLLYTKKSIDLNMERNYLEMLWKGHYNACCISHQLKNIPLMNYHARRCYELIFEGDIYKRSEKEKIHRINRYEPAIRFLINGAPKEINPHISNQVFSSCSLIPKWKNKEYDEFISESQHKPLQIETYADKKYVYCLF